MILKKKILRRKNRDIWFLLSILFLLSSCAKKTSPEIQEVAQVCDLQVFREQEARLIDIPIPFGSKPLKRFAEQAQSSERIMLGYENEMPACALYNFYVQEMERLGWQQESTFNGPEFFLLFSRPGTMSAISIRPHTSNSEIIIYV